MRKLVILSFLFFMLFISLCFAQDNQTENDKSIELKVENLWASYKKIIQIYSDWKDGQEIELEEIHKKWVQGGINQLMSSTGKVEKRDMMKNLFPENDKYTLMLITNPTADPVRSVTGHSLITIAAVKKFFDSKVELVDMNSERISGGLFNLDSKRIESLRSFFKKQAEKENVCSFSTFVMFFKKSDFTQRPDGRWQVRLHDVLTGSCPFAQREKSFEKTIYLIMPYSVQFDLSKIEDNKYIDIRNLISPADLILNVQNLNEFFEWLRKEMKYRGMQI